MLESSTNHGNKIFRIFGLFCMISLSINQSIMIPVWLVILLLLIAFKTSYQEAFKSNIKKSVISIIIGLLLAFWWMWLILNITNTSEKIGIDFNLQLIPGKYISPIVGLITSGEMLQEKDKEISNKDPQTLECISLSERLIKNINNQNLDTIKEDWRNLLSDEEMELIIKKLRSFYELYGAIENIKLISTDYGTEFYDRTNLRENVVKVVFENQKLKLDITCIVDSWSNKQQIVQFNIKPNSQKE